MHHPRVHHAGGAFHPGLRDGSSRSFIGDPFVPDIGLAVHPEGLQGPGDGLQKALSQPDVGTAVVIGQHVVEGVLAAPGIVSEAAQQLRRQDTVEL